MIRAYDRVYLENAQALLGGMLDYAVYELHYTLSDFYSLFLSSGISARFAAGDFSLLAGRSAVEAVFDVLSENNIGLEISAPDYPADRSPEYWAGWALAYYQWETGLSFTDIDKFIPIDTVLGMYDPYHETDIRRFCDRLNELYRAFVPDTALKARRKLLGLSQSELASISGVPIRTIQQYEQRQKNINKAQAEYLVMLSKALGCGVMELLEKVV